MSTDSSSLWNKIKSWPLLLPVVALILVMALNILHDVAVGANPLSFFTITLNQTTSGGTILYGRIIDILNRGSEVAILALGMTLVVSSSAGTDISVGSVMSLSASFCCMLLAGFGVTSTNELRVPLIVGVLAAFAMGTLCGCFNGTLVAYFGIQPMVATLILFSAARAIGLLVCNNMIVYIRNATFGAFGAFTGPLPTPIIIAAICIAIVAVVLRKTSLGMYIQSVGINSKASRIAGLNSKRIIFLTYVICGFFAGVAGLVNSSRITSADSNNIGLYYEMDAILAVALGGNSLGGGKFNLAGSIIGAYTIQAITTTLYALGVSTDQAPVYKAIIVVIIVAIQAPPVRAFFRKRANAKAFGKEAAKA
ncbi:MAG: ABC transporter permease [Lachnospiraceae bacterium]|nr:ABC transporter permease [Lachnospiraceae bacterium]